MNEEPRIILDLCGGTGAWSKPYRAAGYDVRVITLPEYDVTKIIFDTRGWMRLVPQNRPLQLSDDIPYSAISGILAAPPCTEFSVAKGNLPRDLRGAMKIVEACMRVIWTTRIQGKLDFWALENPRGLLRQFLGIPRCTFEQWQFGGARRKATDFWGYFNEPTPTVKTIPQNILRPSYKYKRHDADWDMPKYPQEYEPYFSALKGKQRVAAARAITPAGFAEAFFRANKPRKKLTRNT